MEVPTVSPQEILDALQRVPADRWPQVLAFVRALQEADKAESGSSLPPIRTAGELANSSIVGLWANRSDISDSHAYARQLREQAQQRREPRDASGR
jgi:hypothetical protein